MIEVVSGYGAFAYPLWNGITNDPPPVGWDMPLYADVAWPAAVVADVYTGQFPVPGTQPIWSDFHPRAINDTVLFRHHFNLPTDVQSAILNIDYSEILNEVAINGHTLSIPGSEATIPLDALVLGGDNVLAFSVTNASGTLFVNFAWLSYAFSAQTAADSGTGTGSDVASSGSYGDALSPAMRLRDPAGHTDWEHNGALFRMRSNGLTVCQIPFPSTDAQPSAILGRDPLTGLPMWTGGAASAPPPPSPPAVSSTYTTPDRSLEGTELAPIPLPVPPNKQRVCGAAAGVAVLAIAVYDALVQTINTQKNKIITNFTQDLKAEISDQLVSLLTEAEFAQWEIDAVQLALNILAAIVQTLLTWGTNLPMIWPPNAPRPFGTPNDRTVSQQWWYILCSAFGALWLTGGDYFSVNKSANGLGTKAYWKQLLAPQWSFFAGSTVPGVSQSNPPWQLVWINDIIDAVPDAGWALAASIGATKPSTQCAVCPGYPG